MTISRRRFVCTSSAALGAAIVHPLPSAFVQARASSREQRVDPWLEIDAAALAHNVAALARITGKPVLAVAKNNAYGTGLATAGPLLARLKDVWGLAVVRAEEALALHGAGVRKPILLMGPASDRDLRELLARDVRLAALTDGDAERIAAAARRLAKPARLHLYVDTGMHRMGYPYARALPWIEAIASRKEIRIEGAFTELTEDADFDREQAARCRALADAARAKGLALGRLHAASSDAIMRPNDATFLDLVRPGLSVYGGYPSAESMARGELKPAYRLKARVIRVDELAPGEGVSYHRRFVAQGRTWIATLAVGHVDGYPSGAVNGCEVLAGGKLCPVIGTVSASHTVIALGESATVRVGDEATLVGPDLPALHPNEVAKRAGWSEYNMFMHLSPLLARVVVGDSRG